MSRTYDTLSIDANALYLTEHAPGTWYWLLCNEAGQRVAQCTRSFANSFDCFWDAASTPGVHTARLITLRHTSDRPHPLPAFSEARDPA
ncbi:MAG TPA: hypothetical protein VEB66_01380 [Opitutaceae bacterium]|nr:hypothetical protein [Opitutaceae bacterium]